jgi:hypothetical protein
MYPHNPSCTMFDWRDVVHAKANARLVATIIHAVHYVNVGCALILSAVHAWTCGCRPQSPRKILNVWYPAGWRTASRTSGSLARPSMSAQTRPTGVLPRTAISQMPESNTRGYCSYGSASGVVMPVMHGCAGIPTGRRSWARARQQARRWSDRLYSRREPTPASYAP